MDDFIKWVSITSRHTAMHMDRVLAPYGLNASQYMYIVRVCEQPGLTQDRFLQMFYIHPQQRDPRHIGAGKAGVSGAAVQSKDRRTFCVNTRSSALDVYPAITRLRREWQDTMLAGWRPTSTRDLVWTLCGTPHCAP